MVDVLAEGFHSYPVMRHVLGEDAVRDGTRFRRLLSFFVTARFLRGEPVIGLYDGDGLDAVALISFPGLVTSPPEMNELREAVWRELGAEARERYETYSAAAGQFDVDVPQAHLNMIAVRPALQGMGLGRMLMGEVHRIAREHPESRGVTLVTEMERNVPFYERQGYRLRGYTRITADLETWAFFRPDE